MAVVTEAPAGPHSGWDVGEEAVRMPLSQTASRKSPAGEKLVCREGTIFVFGLQEEMVAEALAPALGSRPRLGM